MARLGRQTPTQAVVLPFSESKGQEAIDLYQSCGRTAQDWQKLLITDILGTDAEGLWVHQKFGYEVPRQNGKGEILTMREFYGLVNGENIIHTAHKTSTSHAAFVRLTKILTDAGYVESGRKKKNSEPPQKSFKSTKQYGLEQIMLKDGGTVVFRTRTEAGGIGESFDLLIIDEAQEYTSTQQSALMYTIAASKNPQTIFCGTPPTVSSKGDVFVNYRKRTISGNSPDSGWAEWSVYSKPDDIMNVDLWYETNPSLGTILRERTIRSEDVSNSLDFIIQRLGFWHSYELKSEITEEEWKTLQGKPEPTGKLFAGVKFGANGRNVSLSIAVKTRGGKTYVETIDCVPQASGFAWIVEFLSNADIAMVAIDGKGKTDILLESLKANGVKESKIKVPTAAEAVTAYATFRQAISDESIMHNGQPSATQAIANCEKRLIGTNGAFGFRSMDDEIDISIVESLAFATWLCMTTKEKRKQKIGY